jgi:hypothetical protein
MLAALELLRENFEKVRLAHIWTESETYLNNGQCLLGVIVGQLMSENKLNLNPDQLSSITKVYRLMNFSKSELDEMRKIVEFKRLSYDESLP